LSASDRGKELRRDDERHAGIGTAFCQQFASIGEINVTVAQETVLDDDDGFDRLWYRLERVIAVQREWVAAAARAERYFLPRSLR
jgi:hypothetical protein